MFEYTMRAKRKDGTYHLPLQVGGGFRMGEWGRLGAGVFGAVSLMLAMMRVGQGGRECSGWSSCGSVLCEAGARPEAGRSEWGKGRNAYID